MLRSASKLVSIKQHFSLKHCIRAWLVLIYEASFAWKPLDCFRICFKPSQPQPSRTERDTQHRSYVQCKAFCLVLVMHHRSWLVQMQGFWTIAEFVFFKQMYLLVISSITSKQKYLDIWNERQALIRIRTKMLHTGSCLNYIVLFQGLKQKQNGLKLWDIKYLHETQPEESTNLYCKTWPGFKQ